MNVVNQTTCRCRQVDDDAFLKGALWRCGMDIQLLQLERKMVEFNGHVRSHSTDQ